MDFSIAQKGVEKFARRVLNKAQFDKLYRAYRRLFRFQIAPVILLAAVVLLELILIPSEAVPNGYASAKETVILFETAFFIVPFYPVWLIVSQFAVGRIKARTTTGFTPCLTRKTSTKNRKKRDRQAPVPFCVRNGNVIFYNSY